MPMSELDFRDVFEAIQIVEDYDRPWAVCGGWAIDLILNRVTRPQKDVDFAVLRRDQPLIQKYLASRGWSLEKAASAQRTPWQNGEWIDLPVHVIWCKNPQASPDFIELLFNEVAEDQFLYRRDPSITLPLEKMIISSLSGVPILAPEIVLLYKSVRLEIPSTAHTEFKNVLSELPLEARSWLAAALKRSNPDHIWLQDLS